MTFTERISSLFQRKSIATNFWQHIRHSWTDYSRFSKRDMIEQAYERNPVFYAAANIIARNVASLPIYVEYKSNLSKREMTNIHPLLRCIEKEDNFMEMLTLYLITTGEAYAHKIFSDQEGKRLLGYIPLPSQYTNPIGGKGVRLIDAFEYSEFDTVKIPKEEVLYIRTPNLSEYLHGYSPASAAAEMIDLYNAGVTWNKNNAKSGGVPDLIAMMEGATKQQRMRFRDSWQSENGGANNAHRIKTIGEAVKLENFAKSPNDIQWSEALMMAFRVISMVVGGSSALLNDSANMTYSNYKEARKALYMETVLPIAYKIFGAINKDASRYFNDDPKIIIDEDKITAIQEDRGLVIDRLTKAAGGQPILTPDEAREELGYSPLTPEQILMIERMKPAKLNTEAPNAL